MQNGISIYLGLDNTLAENLNLIHLAHKYNLNRIFTSFHIPETDISHFQQDLQTILKLTQKYNMEVICERRSFIEEYRILTFYLFGKLGCIVIEQSFIIYQITHC